MTWVTENLINDIFPELRTSSYEHEVLENDNMGEMDVHYSEEDIDNESISISKHYDSSDYTNLELAEITNPDVDFNRKVSLDKESGIAFNGETKFLFKMGEKKDNL
jgi:hypothetical protein